MLNADTINNGPVNAGMIAAGHASSFVTLPFYGDLSFPVVEASGTATATLRIQEASVYDYHGQPSLGFVFPFRRETRHTARIRDQRTVTDADGATFKAYLTSIFVRCEGLEGDLDVWLIEAPLTHADATISRQSLQKLS